MRRLFVNKWRCLLVHWLYHNHLRGAPSPHHNFTQSDMSRHRVGVSRGPDAKGALVPLKPHHHLPPPKLHQPSSPPPPPPAAMQHGVARPKTKSCRWSCPSLSKGQVYGHTGSRQLIMAAEDPRCCIRRTVCFPSLHPESQGPKAGHREKNIIASLSFFFFRPP